MELILDTHLIFEKLSVDLRYGGSSEVVLVCKTDG